MKTAISVPDDLHAEVDRLARRLKRSRSRLYADAAREYVARHDPDAVTNALDRLCGSLDCAIDPAVAAAGTGLLQRVEW
jgi:metal-responsive CopG/Arc/MetJ family transcriptional regulator